MSLTDYQGYQGARRLWQETASGGFRDFYNGASSDVQKEIASMTGNAGWYSYLSYGIESKADRLTFGRRT